MLHFMSSTLVSPLCDFDFSDHNSVYPFFVTSHCNLQEVWTNHAMSECAVELCSPMTGIMDYGSSMCQHRFEPQFYALDNQETAAKMQYGIFISLFIVDHRSSFLSL